MPAPPYTWPSRPALAWTLFALGAAAGAWVLFRFDPQAYHFYPLCFLHRSTGLLCPGCGALRALHQLLHGHVAAAFQFNPMLIASLPLVAWLGARSAWQLARKQPVQLGLHPVCLWLWLAAVLACSILRNVPGGTFALLHL